MKFKNLKTGTKILSGFMLVLLIAIIIGAIGLWGLGNVGRSFHQVTDVRLPSIQYLGAMEANLEKLQAGYKQLLDTELSRADRDAIVTEINQSRSEYQRYNELFAPLEQTEEESRVYKQLLQDLETWRNINTQKVDQLHAEVLATDILDPISLNRDLEQFMKDHYALQVQVSNSMQTSRLFDGGEDATKCNFGLWLPDFKTNNAEINRNMRDMNVYHDAFHGAVHRIKQLVQQGNRDAAFKHYQDVMIPSAENVFNYFAVINREAQRAANAFQEMSRTISVESNGAHQAVMASFRQLQEINMKEAGLAVETGDSASRASNGMMIISIFIGIAVALMLGFTITRLVTTGVNKGVDIAKTIAAGDLTVSVESSLLEQKDEIGELANAMQQMVDKLSNVIGSVVSGSGNIASASQQMSSTAQEMSQGSTEQASSAEEVSSSMEQMAANIQQNTDNARETEKMARQAETGIIDSSKASEQAVVAMRDIAEKIGIIGEISRQTNILALNAAVEAARAGEHGKGFAVVAAEVRKLAERSQVAAAEIDKLSKFGVSISEEAGKKLAAIVPEIQRTASLVQEIAAASIEQNSGADQVNSAIQQLNHVTQQNAAASEEMATSSEELASQADQLLEMVAYFKLDDTVSKKSTRKITAKSNVGAIMPPASVKPGKSKSNLAQKISNGGVKINMGQVMDEEFEKF
jgi:methyl-accepting chemotaxis protein